LIASVLLAAAAAAGSPPVDRFPAAAKSYLVAIDGRVVWEKDADRPRLPASLTKVMTALVLLERDWDPAAPVTVSARAAAETGSRAGLRARETLPAGQLLDAMLVASANDACVALAEHTTGSVSSFVLRMNARARDMGLSATSFANPCGHDDPKQRSSARDLRAIAEAAMTLPEIAHAVALREARLTTATGRVLTVKTGNALLGGSPGVSGVKSGYTPGAGKCVIVAAERDGTKVLVVLLDAADRWWAAAALVEAAFDEARAKP
jgi:serine-type D-Ala-D-Ala carboxypeptidase (penicillin-binding protein 5/6)